MLCACCSSDKDSEHMVPKNPGSQLHSGSQVMSLIKHDLTGSLVLIFLTTHWPWPEHRGSAHSWYRIWQALVSILHSPQGPQSLSRAHPFGDEADIDNNDANAD
jgi:hypothetical protein